MDRNAVLAVKISFIFSGLYSKESAEHVQQLLQKNEVPPNLFELYVEEIFSYLRGCQRGHGEICIEILQPSKWIFPISAQIHSLLVSQSV